MTTRQELLDRWRDRFFEAEEACLDPQTDSWNTRLRRKLYWFLLTMYGQSEWPGPKDDVDNEAGRRKNSQLVVAEPNQELAGKEPRTRAQILKGLQNIQGLSKELAPAGPLTEGLSPISLVAVATFKKADRAGVALRRLRRAGLAPQMRRHSKLYQILVAAGDFAVATMILDKAAIESSVPASGTRTIEDREVAAAIERRTIVPEVFPRDDNLSLLGGIVYGCAGLFLTVNVAAYYWKSQPLIGPQWNTDLTRLLAIAALMLNLVSICSLWNWWRWR